MSEVVVGFDGSEGAAAALRWGVAEGELHGWAVEAVMAWGFLDQHPSGRPFDPSYGEGSGRDALDRSVVAAVGEAAAATVARRLICDLPARALVEASSDSRLLVVGARGLGGFRGLLLGSVSEHCLHHSHVPVAIVRGCARAPASAGRIVAAVDGSEESHTALRWALDEAALRGCSVEVVHAWHAPYVTGIPYVDGIPDVDEYEKASHEVLEAAFSAAGGWTAKASATLSSVHGVAAAAVIKAAGNADLVVLGTRGRGGVAGRLLGSVSRQVAHHAPCPVVVVPRPS